jgi:hypothetical protein
MNKWDFPLYVVKTWGPEDGYVNRMAFARKTDADWFAKTLELKDFHETRGIHEEFVQVEKLGYVV